MILSLIICLALDQIFESPFPVKSNGMFFFEKLDCRKARANAYTWSTFAPFKYLKFQ